MENELLEHLVYPKEFFVTDNTFQVDPDLKVFVDLSPCPNDTRRLQQLVQLQCDQNEEDIAKKHFGGTYFLYKKHATVPQLMHEIDRMRQGEESFFTKEADCFAHLIGYDGRPCLVYLYHAVGRLYIQAFRWKQYGALQTGYCLYGN